MAARERIRVGIGGWTYEPWRDTFYPAGLPAARELHYASRQLNTIEVNGTYYSLQSAKTFAKWHAETPDDFVFTLKASRYATNRRVLAEAGESIQRFTASGIAELGAKLGPVVWQFAPTKRFDEGDFGAFLGLLPKQAAGVPLRHAVEVRHESFRCPAYLALARRHGVATVFTDADDYPAFADITGSFVYVRTMRTQPQLALGCTPETLADVAACARCWQAGAEPARLPRVEPVPTGARAAPRDVFLMFISAAKEKAPLAARHVLGLLGDS